MQVPVGEKIKWWFVVGPLHIAVATHIPLENCASDLAKHTSNLIHIAQTNQ